MVPMETADTTRTFTRDRLKRLLRQAAIVCCTCFVMPTLQAQARQNSSSTYEEGKASAYAPHKHENGGLTMAHRTWAFYSHVLVTNRENGREVCVIVNDQGPHVKGVVADLSWTGAERIRLTRTK